jgi:hypothetical protein
MIDLFIDLNKFYSFCLVTKNYIFLYYKLINLFNKLVNVILKNILFILYNF